MAAQHLLDNGQGVIDPDTYFEIQTPPPNLAQDEAKVRDFVKYNLAKNNRLVLVTSGGTQVPLENQTVRFIDNFSAGTRGATSAEYFLEYGYAVIFMHRQHSLQPYSRNYTHSTNCFLDYLELKPDDSMGVSQAIGPKLIPTFKKYQSVKQRNMLLFVEFTTLTDYLFLLRSITLIMAPMKSKAMYYLAAAVSDFFIPAPKMAEHKIQSSEGALTLHLDQVPKFLKPLVSQWASESFIVSFKASHASYITCPSGTHLFAQLETDSRLLVPKARAALTRYGHQIVIGNMLTTRKRDVTLITKEDDVEIHLTDQELRDEVEIEERIVKELYKRHGMFISTGKSCAVDGMAGVSSL
ncbi:hypothetical protein BZG36_01661 [Bifiguratus adelaidae]|uniref:DNA/pantothenate metabolism flavoprotein C-terminal domain-containing protein n=1 Tax=Bifiguratus adelaidae TaxID=1938954 RepID=A0A261Y4S5_9FUNG|nr:hypothetical protein BZG36_01661 [Bifiguratus adelaidae]